MDKDTIIMSNSTWDKLEELMDLSIPCAMVYLLERIRVLDDKKLETLLSYL